MSLEFYSAGNSTMNALKGIAKKADNSRIAQSDSDDKSARFKDLFNQSKQELNQADRRLETIRESQKDSQAAEESKKPESNQETSEVTPKDTVAKVDDAQQEETEPKEVQADENPEDSSLLTVESAQLLGIQNFQGMLNETQTNFSLNLGSEENTIQGNLVEQVQNSQVVDLKGQTAGDLITEDVSQFDANLIDEMQMSGTEGKIEGIDENQKIELFPGLSKKVEAEVISADSLKNQVSSESESAQTNAVDNPTIQKVDSQNQGIGNGSQTEDTSANNTAAQSETEGSNSLESFNVEQSKIGSGQENLLAPTETENLGEKGMQGINASSINTAKGSEVQANTNTPVVQQVEQKILQNFEANKPMVLQMTLSPENLGDVDIQLKYDQGKLIIDILAASQETQKLLGKHINQLVRGLALQNVQVETVHLNTPVEASSTGENTASLMNSGSDFSQQQNNAQLRESFLRNSSIQNSLLNNGNEGADEGIISIAQNLQYNGQRRINYLV